jgi:hypothetical protein
LLVTLSNRPGIGTFIAFSRAGFTEPRLQEAALPPSIHGKTTILAKTRRDPMMISGRCSAGFNLMNLVVVRQKLVDPTLMD